MRTESNGPTYHQEKHMNDRIDSLILSTIPDSSTPVSEDDAWDAFQSVVGADGHLQHMLEYELADEESLFEDFLQDTNLNIV